MILVKLRRSELRKAGACEDGIRFFNSIATKGIWQSEWTQLHAVWLAVARPSDCAWLISNRMIPIANLTVANLSRANLTGANLSRANLSGANLSGANLSRAILGDWERGPDGYARRKA